MLRLVYSPDFIRKYKKLSSPAAYELKERLEEFKDLSNHKKLKVHKLKGAMQGQYAFSLNYRDRVIFEWSKDKKTAYLLDVGDHTIYE